MLGRSLTLKLLSLAGWWYQTHYISHIKRPSAGRSWETMGSVFRSLVLVLLHKKDDLIVWFCRGPGSHWASEYGSQMSLVFHWESLPQPTHYSWWKMYCFTQVTACFLRVHHPFSFICHWWYLCRCSSAHHQHFHLASFHGWWMAILNSDFFFLLFAWTVSVPLLLYLPPPEDCSWVSASAQPLICMALLIYCASCGPTLKTGSRSSTGISQESCYALPLHHWHYAGDRFVYSCVLRFCGVFTQLCA